MCGITGIFLKNKSATGLTGKVLSMTSAIKHRGPDGEGYLLAGEDMCTPFKGDDTPGFSRNDLAYLPQATIPAAPEGGHYLALGHRRLSIIDLSDTGHQPMCDVDRKLWIVYNGEIYNYIELRAALKTLGHKFVSESDTEVILIAYKQWGENCVEKFNGMWAFCIYDREKKKLFASRDRLGVKPFYFVNNHGFFAFASEQKAFTNAGLMDARANTKVVQDYLLNGLLENSSENFFEGITELWPGNNLVFDLESHNTKIQSYFHLNAVLSVENDNLSEGDLVDRINTTLKDAVRMRLRSDVEVGTCLSGGIDSSGLAVLIAELKKEPLFCFTSIFKHQPFNEEHFADLVSNKINARHYKIEPTLEGFIKEADALIYSQDVPIWDTSTYAQYKVMELAKENGVKVVLDGQGADELFGGYHHHFTAKWNNLLGHGKYSEALRDINISGKSINRPFLFYMKEKAKEKFFFNRAHLSFFFKSGFIRHGAIKNPAVHFNDVNAQLVDDIYNTRLKSFLKCEDRCGMWHSVESRTPFSDDIDLIKLAFSFNGNKKITMGRSKYLLREALKNKLPEAIYTRYDKKGFETPMQDWMKKLRPVLVDEIKASAFDFVDMRKIDAADPNNRLHNKMLFKLFVLGRWQKLFKERRS